MDNASRADFAQALIRWQKQAGRHDLPWQQPGRARDPYRVWLAEIMLQQTQVATVIPYYVRFLARFPDLARLAAAPAEEVMALWSGLGYYARARNLQRAAQDVVAKHGGRFPRRIEDIGSLPGVGRSTAAAIAVFAFGARAAILDGNVRRVLARVFGIEGFPGEKKVEARLWALAEALLPRRDLVAYTQGLMDLGATLCRLRRPRCGECPVAASCVARREDRIAGLPTPRAKRAVPQRSVTLLVLRSRGRVLLEQRPPHGRLVGDPPIARIGLGRADDGERLLALLALDEDGRADGDVVGGVVLVDQDRVLDQGLERQDPALHERLLVLGVLVLGVLLEVAVLLGVVDPCRDLGAAHGDHLVELRAELVKAFSG